jgi:hypothetical protein
MRLHWGLRLAVEAAFIIAVLVVAKLADLGVVGIILAAFFAWLLVVIAEGIIERGWQGAATFVPPIRPLTSPLGLRDRPPPPPAPEFETSIVPPEEVAPEWLESAEVLGVQITGFEPAPAVEAEVEEAPAEPAEPVAEAEPRPLAAPPRAAVARRRSRLPRRLTAPPRRAPSPAAESAAEEPQAEPPGETPPEPEASEPSPREWQPPDRRWPWRRPRGGEPERPGLAAAERKEDQPELPLFEVPERLCRSCGQPISKDRLRAIPNATRCIDCKRAGRAEPVEIVDLDLPDLEGASEETPESVEAVAEPEPEPAPVAFGATAAVGAPAGRSSGGWNVWELEKLARRLGGNDSARDEEWAFLLVYLREFANPEGLLPTDFDALVRESFPELVSAAETS